MNNVDTIKVFGSRVLVEIYVRPQVTAGGVHLPTQHLDEDLHQGKVGRVMKLGPLAFQDDDTHHFPERPEVGDWVVFRVGDTFPFRLGNRDRPEEQQHCRFVEDVNIAGTIPNPHMVW